ncbi:MAG: hypothetical protein ACFCBW_09605 [Candidatus Competibacterales bacterium]
MGPLILLLSFVLLPGLVLAQVEPTPGGSPGEFAGEIAAGVTVAEALRQIGRSPDHTTRVGVCGTMDVLSWEREGLRLLISGNRVVARQTLPSTPTDSSSVGSASIETSPPGDGKATD